LALFFGLAVGKRILAKFAKSDGLLAEILRKLLPFELLRVPFVAELFSRAACAGELAALAPIEIRPANPPDASPSPKLHPAEELNRFPDFLTVKSRTDPPTRAIWKAMKIKTEGIFGEGQHFSTYASWRWTTTTSLLQNLNEILSATATTSATWRELFRLTGNFCASVL
jgi:hypothetical protein